VWEQCFLPLVLFWLRIHFLEEMTSQPHPQTFFACSSTLFTLLLLASDLLNASPVYGLSTADDQTQVQNGDHQETILFGSCNRQVTVSLSPLTHPIPRIYLKTFGTVLMSLTRKTFSGLVMQSIPKTQKLMACNLL
jgi:hypothetical protein